MRKQWIPGPSLSWKGLGTRLGLYPTYLCTKNEIVSSLYVCSKESSLAIMGVVVGRGDVERGVGDMIILYIIELY